MCPKLLLLAFRFTGSFTFSVVSSVFQPEGQEALEPKGGEASTFTESRPVYRLMTCGRVRREETIPTRQGTGREEQRRGSEWVRNSLFFLSTRSCPPCFGLSLAFPLWQSVGCVLLGASESSSHRPDLLPLCPRVHYLCKDSSADPCFKMQPIKQIRYYDQTANLPPSIPGCQVW